MGNRSPQRLYPMTDAEWAQHMANLQEFNARHYARARELVRLGLYGHACVWQRLAANRAHQLRALVAQSAHAF